MRPHAKYAVVVLGLAYRAWRTWLASGTNLRLLESGTVHAAVDALVEVGADLINLRPQRGRVVVRSPHSTVHAHGTLSTGHCVSHLL